MVLRREYILQLVPQRENKNHPLLQKKGKRSFAILGIPICRRFINQSSGFTLIEVALSVAILGVALATLLGLQTSVTSQYIFERNLTQAALYAQYIMTTIEVEKEIPKPGAKESSLRESLSEAGYFEEQNFDDSEKEEIKNWRMNLEVSSIDIPPISDALRRIDLVVSWGETEEQSYKLVYFAFTNSQQKLENLF